MSEAALPMQPVPSLDDLAGAAILGSRLNLTVLLAAIHRNPLWHTLSFQWNNNVEPLGRLCHWSFLITFLPHQLKRQPLHESPYFSSSPEIEGITWPKDCIQCLLLKFLERGCLTIGLVSLKSDATSSRKYMYTCVRVYVCVCKDFCGNANISPVYSHRECY